MEFNPPNYWKTKPLDDSFEQYKQKLQQAIKNTKFVKIIGNYGITKSKYPNSTHYSAMDLSTGLYPLSGRTSLKKIEKEIQEGKIEKMRQSGYYPTLFDIRKSYNQLKRAMTYHKKYGDKSKRFDIVRGQKVLDIGAGGSPDIRATHAIDLIKPEKTFGINYKHGYDFNKESTKLPYPSNYFDVVVSYGGLGLNFRSNALCNEIYRVLKPGGTFEGNITPYKNIVNKLKKAGLTLCKDKYYNEYIGEYVDIIVGTK